MEGSPPLCCVNEWDGQMLTRLPVKERTASRGAGNENVLHTVVRDPHVHFPVQSRGEVASFPPVERIFSVRARLLHLTTLCVVLFLKKN